LIVVLWRAGLRISEATRLAEGDLDPARGALLVQRGKGGKRREVGMDEWGWEHLRRLDYRATLPAGALFCVISGRTRGRPWSAPAIRTQFQRLARTANVRRRFAPHQLRHAHAVEMAREGVPLNVIQRQLGHADLGITSVYLQGIDSAEVISAIHGRRPPTMPASAGLRM
jgi:site-specific recombinase XerD